MSDFGLTANGFIAKRLDDIRAERETRMRELFGPDIKTTPDTILGKLIALESDREAELWELMEAVYNSAYPDTASGQSLAMIGQLTGVRPNAATRSVVTVYLTGTPGVTIPALARIATPNAGDQFELTAAVTLAGAQFGIQSLTRSGSTVTAAATAHGRTVGQWIFVTGANQAEYNGLRQIATVPNANSFTYAITGTPATPATGAIQGNPATAGTARATVTGPIQALSRTLTQIVNPIVGWSLVSNALDATLGRNAETDAEFRTRRINTLTGLGAARHAAILGALLAIDGVHDATVFVNDTDGVVSGRPAHSIECLVQGGDDQAIFDTIWNKKAGGIEAHGSVVGATVDSQGTSHTVKFSRVTGTNIWVELDIFTNAEFPVNGEALALAAILDFGNTLGIGDDVIVYPALVGALAGIPGINDLVVRIGTAMNPTLDDNVVIGPSAIAVFDSSRVTIAIDPT